MTLERAAEILDPQHREDYDSMETINEACEIGRKAIAKQIPKKPIKCRNSLLYALSHICPSCGGGFSGTGIADYCYHCGQALDWNDEEQEDIK